MPTRRNHSSRAERAATPADRQLPVTATIEVRIATEQFGSAGALLRLLSVLRNLQQRGADGSPYFVRGVA